MGVSGNTGNKARESQEMKRDEVLERDIFADISENGYHLCNKCEERHLRAMLCHEVEEMLEETV